jgi:hypothetical protein
MRRFVGREGNPVDELIGQVIPLTSGLLLLSLHGAMPP